MHDTPTAPPARHRARDRAPLNPKSTSTDNVAAVVFAAVVAVLTVGCGTAPALADPTTAPATATPTPSPHTTSPVTTVPTPTSSPSAPRSSSSTTVSLTPTLPPSPSSTATGSTTCPALYLIGVQTGDEGAASSVDTGDTGMLGQVFGPITAAVGDSVAREYIGFGASDTNSATYRSDVTAAGDRIEQTATAVTARCEQTRIGVVGYAQGAAAAAVFAENVGAGRSGVPADKVAGIALLSNPSRRAAQPVLPGTDSGTPNAVPGTGGTHVGKVALSNVGLSGAGIDAAAQPANYGTLAGRVADLCVAGDATCDVTSGSPLATAVANIAGQTEGKDPVAAITTVARALAATVFTTAVGVVNDDLTGTSLDQLTYDPTQTLGQRIATASSPTATTATSSDALSALFKLGSIGLNAVVSVARTVFTASTIAELATVGLANPWAAVATLGAKVATAVVDLVPPQSISTWVNSAFEAITSTITDSADLYTTSATAQYSDSTGRRASYSTVAATTDGHSPVTAVADWFTAAAHDLAPPGTEIPARTTTPTVTDLPATPRTSATTPPHTR
ncbi:cutinase family protein [Nocardia sp. NPDC058658]|uniref:cutinase family protein n=1 Tax=Nocardia sp. NPDC058658 TaxID=3346580 RepID=UPI003649BDED